MSFISEQVRKIAEQHENLECVSILQEAADTIESLSAKLQAANEELADAKEAIRKLLCDEYGSSCQFCIHDNDNDAMCSNVGGSGSWCCENAKWNGKTL